MARPLEDYALIGDMRTAALVARDGAIDWFCAPRFDSGAAFAAFLGGDENGRWALGPAKPERKAERRYRGDTLVLETRHRPTRAVFSSSISCRWRKGRVPICCASSFANRGGWRSRPGSIPASTTAVPFPGCAPSTGGPPPSPVRMR